MSNPGSDRDEFEARLAAATEVERKRNQVHDEIFRSHTMDITWKIFYVEGQAGEYGDKSEWQVAWCATKAEADELCVLCTADDASLTRDERNAQDWSPAGVRRKEKLAHDPHWRGSYEGVRYRVWPMRRWRRPIVNQCTAELDGYRCGMVRNHDDTHYALIDGKTVRWHQ